MFITFPNSLSILHLVTPTPASAFPRRDFLRKPVSRVFLAACLLLFAGLLPPSAAQAQTPSCKNIETVARPDVSAYQGDDGPWMHLLWGRVHLDLEVSSYIVRWGTSESTASEVDVGRANAYILGKNPGENLDWDTTYKVWVRAERPGGEVCWSEAAEVKTPSSSPPPSSSSPSNPQPSSPPPAAPGGSSREDTCPDYTPATTAQDVERLKDPETLADFVEEAREGIRTLLSNTVPEEEGIRNLVKCFGADGDWKHGSVHLFMISADEDRKFFLAPGDSNLAGTSLDIEDENGCDVGEEILRAAGGEELQCDDLDLAGDDPGPGFVQYLWRDPDDPDSEDYDSPRLSYVEKISFESFLPSGSFVLGSGYYPEISVPEPEGETTGSGGGCALVAETDARDDGAVGLFLGVLAVGCAVFLGRGVFSLRG